MEFNSGTKQILLFIKEDWLLLLILTALFSLYFYYTSTFDFFEKKGICFMEPTIILGNLGSRLRPKQSYHEFQLDIYNFFKRKGKLYGGIFEGRKPILYVIDPDIIKDVTIRDFKHFVDRNTISLDDVLGRSLLNLKGAEWKGVRSTVTPAFSSARLQNMMPLIQLCSEQMVRFLKQCKNSDVELKDTMGHYTLEVIGACAFGIKCDALSDENSRFIKLAEKFNYMPKLKRLLILFLLMFMPTMFKVLKISFLHTETVTELVELLKAAKAERRLSGTKKADFLQLLIDASENERTELNSDKLKTYLDDDTIDAQSLLFLLGGYETSSTLLSFAIHTLATKPELQTQLRSHIEEVTDGKEMSYEVISQLSYLDAFLLETLRMYPPVARLDRICTQKYTLPGSPPVQVDVGDVLAVSLYGIHMDPTIYPEPLEFKPERFMQEQKNERPSHLFLAFGAGQRNCIGMRFAMFSVKFAMVSLLKNFKFSICAKTEDPIKFTKSAVLLKAENGLWVHIDAL